MMRGGHCGLPGDLLDAQLHFRATLYSPTATA